MTNGELFIRENPNIEFKINGSCVWIYFDNVNHYTMPVSWWDKEIGLFDKLRAEIESLREPTEPHLVDYRYHRNDMLDMVLGVIDRYRSEVSE